MCRRNCGRRCRITASARRPAEIAKWRGAAKREIIRHFVDLQSDLPPNVDREKLTSTIYDEFTANLIAIYRSVPPIAGAEDAIRQLRKSGYLVATTTGFDRAICTSIFHRLGWEQHFAAMICSDDVAQGRPAPYMLFHAMEAARVLNVAEVMAVGDTPLDLQAGSNAGVRAVVGRPDGRRHGRDSRARAAYAHCRRASRIFRRCWPSCSRTSRNLITRPGGRAFLSALIGVNCVRPS